jgi:hypothetical protein
MMHPRRACAKKRDADRIPGRSSDNPVAGTIKSDLAPQTPEPAFNGGL